MKSILFEAMDFIKIIDTQSAVDFNDWVKVQLNIISE